MEYRRNTYQKKQKTSQSGSNEAVEQISPPQGLVKMRRVQSGKINLKTNKDNYFAQQKDSWGGGFYKRSQIMNAQLVSYPSDPQFLTKVLGISCEVLPPIESTQQKQRVERVRQYSDIKSNSQQLAQIMEEQQDEGLRDEELTNNGLLRRLQQYRMAEELLKTKLLKQMNLVEQLQKQKQSLDQESMVKQVQHYIQGQHHCHFEEQVKELQELIRIKDIQSQRTHSEIDKIMAMMKAYNTNGLMERNCSLESELTSIKGEQILMLHEIQMLGMQRDGWEVRFKESQESIAITQDTQQRLEDTEKRYKQQTETLQGLNKRYRERQLEVQEYQHRLTKSELAIKEQSHQHEQLNRKLESQISLGLSTIEQLKTDIAKDQQTIRQHVMCIEQEQQNHRVLVAQIQDLHVNQIPQLTEQLRRSKKTISDRVEDIEELEKQAILMQQQIENLESKVRLNERKHEQEVSDLYADWKKKQWEHEQSILLLRADINQLHLQVLVQEENFKQKDAEHQNALERINEYKLECDEHRKTELHLKSTISTQESKIESLQCQCGTLEEAITQHEFRAEAYQYEITQMNQDITLKDQTIQTKDTEIATLTDIIIALRKEMENHKEKLRVSLEDNKKITMQYQDEQQRVQLYQERNTALQTDVKDLKEQLEVLINVKTNLTRDLKQTQEQKVKLIEQIKELREQEEIRQQALLDKIRELTKENEQLKSIMDIQITQIDQLKDIQDKDQEQLALQRQQIILLETKSREQQNNLELQYKELETIKIQINQNPDEQYGVKEEFDRMNKEMLLIKSQNSTLQTECSGQIIEITQLKEQVIEIQKELYKYNGQVEQKDKDIVVLVRGMSDTSIPNVKQVLIEEKVFSNHEDNVKILFNELNFDQLSRNLNLMFWVRVEQGIQHKNHAPLPFLTIQNNSNEEKLLEMGVLLNTGAIYATYFPSMQLNNHSPQGAREQPLTLTSQCFLKFGQFAHVGLMLSETGGGHSRMDMGIFLNGQRDDQVSVQRSLLMPEAMITLGHLHINEVEQPRSFFIERPIERRNFVIRDALVLTRELSKTNIYRLIKEQFDCVYNPSKKQKYKKKQLLPQKSYSNANDFLYDIIMKEAQNKTQNPSPNRYRKYRSRSKSPQYTAHHYSVQRPLSIRGRVIPTGFVNEFKMFANN